MTNLNLKDYPNMFDYLLLPSSDIENQIQGYSLNFPQTRHPKVEWEMSFPMFLPSFYKYVWTKKIIPDQLASWEYYLLQNRLFFDSKKFDNEIIDALMAREFRTYPSLVRDIHFSNYLRENFEDATIIYNTKLDIELGVDLLIVYKDKLWSVNLYVKTSRALLGREKKAHRHDQYQNVNYIELPVDMKGSKKIGDFFLYSEPEYQKLRSIIEAKV